MKVILYIIVENFRETYHNKIKENKQVEGIELYFIFSETKILEKEIQYEDEFYIDQPKGEKLINYYVANNYQDESNDNVFYTKEMNLYNNRQRKIEKQRELLLIKEQENYEPWKIAKNSRKIIMEKLKNEKPLYERTLDVAEKKKRELEFSVKVQEIKNENELKKMKTRWNNGKLNNESFDNFVEKQNLWKQNKANKVMFLKETYDEIEKKAIEETMFKPQIKHKSNSISKNINNGNKKVHERLFEYNEELKNKKANLEKNNIPKFIPNINKKLPKYIKNKQKGKLRDLNNEEFNNLSGNYSFNQSNIRNYNNDEMHINDANNINKNYIDCFQNDEKMIQKNQQYLGMNINNNIKNNRNNSCSMNEMNSNYNPNNERKNSAPINQMDINYNPNYNRKNSAPNEKNNFFNPKINSLSKPKLNLRGYDLNTIGLQTDFNNVKAGNNLKNLINKNKEENFYINENETKSKNSQNKKGTDKAKNILNDKLPIEKFSIPISNIKLEDSTLKNNKYSNFRESEKISNLKLNSKQQLEVGNNNVFNKFSERIYDIDEDEFEKNISQNISLQEKFNLNQNHYDLEGRNFNDYSVDDFDQENY